MVYMISMVYILLLKMCYLIFLSVLCRLWDPGGGVKLHTICSQRTVCDGVEGMCTLLKKGCPYTDMVPSFGRNPTELCLIFNEVLDFIYNRYQHRPQNCGLNPFLQRVELQKYEDAICQHGAPLQNFWLHQPLLKTIYKTPPIISYKRGKSLKDILVRAKL